MDEIITYPAFNPEFMSLLDILRAALSGKGEIRQQNFAPVIAEARRQTVDGIILSFLAGKGLLPPEEKMRAIARILALEKANSRADIQVAGLVRLLEANGIRHAMMKGQTVARFYPDTQLRIPGDIDVYVAEQDFRRACLLLEEQGYTNTDFTMLHATYSKKECTEVELHFAVQKLQWLPHFRSLQRMTRKYVDNAKPHYTVIAGERIPVLPPCMEAVLLTVHAFNHVLNGGLGLRQVLDWMLGMQCLEKDIDKTVLVEMLRDTGMTRMFRTLYYICSRHLGMSLDATAWNGTGLLHVTEKNEKTGMELMHWIGEAGNFGHSLNLSKIQYYLLFLKNCWRFRRLNRKEMFVYPFMKIKRGITGENHLRK